MYNRIVRLPGNWGNRLNVSSIARSLDVLPRFLFVSLVFFFNENIFRSDESLLVIVLGTSTSYKRINIQGCTTVSMMGQFL